MYWTYRLCDVLNMFPSLIHIKTEFNQKNPTATIR